MFFGPLWDDLGKAQQGKRIRAGSGNAKQAVNGAPVLDRHWGPIFCEMGAAGRTTEARPVWLLAGLFLCKPVKSGTFRSYTHLKIGEVQSL